jgi:hypothetical protein
MTRWRAPTLNKRKPKQDYEASRLIEISDYDSSGADEDEVAQRVDTMNEDAGELDDSDNGSSKNDDEAKLERVAERTRPGQIESKAPPGRDPVLQALIRDGRPEVPDRQSRFSSLPKEIKYVFLSYLDKDPYSIYSLSMVSRSWYLVLNQDSSTDVDWQRRCSVMGAQRHSPHCKTWRETFIRQIHKRCLVCLKISDAAFGHLLRGQPDWMTVCSTCQMEPGPWQTISEDEALQRSTPKALRTLPFRAVKNTGTSCSSATQIGKNGKSKLKKFIKYYLASDVGGDPFDTHIHQGLKCFQRNQE